MSAHRVAQTDGSCCNGSGLADYAAVPCPNPDCPVTEPIRLEPPSTEGLAPLDQLLSRRDLSPDVRRRIGQALATVDERLDLVLAYLQTANHHPECEVLHGLQRGLAAFRLAHPELAS